MVISKNTKISNLKTYY